MPSAQNLTVNDGVADVIFKPRKVADGTAVFQADHVDGVTFRDGISATNRLETDSKGQMSRLVVRVPVVEVIDGVSTVVGADRVFIEVAAEKGLTPARIKRARILAANVLQSADIISMIEDGEQIFG